MHSCVCIVNVGPRAKGWLLLKAQVWVLPQEPAGTHTHICTVIHLQEAISVCSLPFNLFHPSRRHIRHHHIGVYIP